MKSHEVQKTVVMPDRDPPTLRGALYAAVIVVGISISNVSCEPSNGQSGTEIAPVVSGYDDTQEHNSSDND
jgi:hypothetical protein